MGHVLREVSCYGIITTGVKNIKLNRPSTTPAHYKVIPAVSLHSHVAATVGSSTMGSRKSERSKNMPVSLNPRIQSLFHHVEGEEPKFHRRLEKIHTNPAIYLVRNFLSDVDLDYLDRNITQHASKFKASYTEDESGKKCVSDERTSTYIFLDKGRDATIRNLEMRASDLISLSSDFVEPLQIVSYTGGQKFDLHHDAGTIMDDGEIEIVQPRRLVTLFLYLNNLPKGQGCTEFPALNLRITPERGCGILFCNVMPNGDADLRTAHKACPVDAGLRKYGMNVWMTESSMLHMKTKSAISGCVLVSKKDFDSDKSSSALSSAERMTEEFKGAIKKEEEIEKSDTMTTVVVRTPHSVSNWLSTPEEHESIGKGLAAEFVKSEEEEVSVDDKSPVLSPPTAEAGESETREDAPSPLSAVQICTGKVTRYAPAPSSSSPDSTTVSVEGLYETLWQDGATLYFGESAYQNARILFEKISAESDQVARSAEVESKKRKIAEDEKEKEEEEEGADDDDSDDEDVADEGGEVKRIKFEGGVSSRIQNQGPKDTMLMRSKYSVPFETVLKWRDKKGVNLEYVLGCSLTSTEPERSKFIEALTCSGKLICILCNQTISGTRKSLQKHQLTKRHSALHAEVFSGGRDYPSSDFAMVIDIPPMAEPEPYRPPNHPSSLALSASSSSAHNINSQSASLQDHTSRYSVRTGESTGWTGVSTFGGEDEEGRGASAAAIPTDLEGHHTQPRSGTVDASTMATSLETVKSWRDKRSINVDYVLGCADSHTAAERERAEKILLSALKIICILCNQTVAGNKKSLRRHQRESKRHMIMSQEIFAGQRAFPSTEAAMCMPMPLPVVSRSHQSNVHQQASGASDGTFVPRAYTYPHPQAPRPSCAASAFSVTMPCALAWKEKTGLDTEYLLGISDNATKEERNRAETLLITCGKLICILCNQTLAGNRKSVYKHMLTKKHVGQCHDVTAGRKAYPTTEQGMSMEVPLPVELPDLPLLPLSYQSANVAAAPAAEEEGEFCSYSSACVAVEDSDSETDGV